MPPASTSHTEPTRERISATAPSAAIAAVQPSPIASSARYHATAAISARDAATTPSRNAAKVALFRR